MRFLVGIPCILTDQSLPHTYFFLYEERRIKPHFSSSVWIFCTCGRQERYGTHFFSKAYDISFILIVNWKQKIYNSTYSVVSVIQNWYNAFFLLKKDFKRTAKCVLFYSCVLTELTLMQKYTFFPWYSFNAYWSSFPISHRVYQFFFTFYIC